MKRIFQAACIVLCTQSLWAQRVDFPEYWAGYITSYRFSDKWSVWNDFHTVPDLFWINRHGITWHFRKRSELTAGFAFLLTAVSWTDALIRDEYRPWWQYETRGPLGKMWGYRLRFRWDHRIRREIQSSELTDDFISYERLRVMATLRRDIKKYPNGHRLSINLHNELLVNEGKESPPNQIDQFRIFLLAGYSWPNLNVQAGVHDRLVPVPGNDEVVHNLGFTVWVIQRFYSKKYAESKGK